MTSASQRRPQRAATWLLSVAADNAHRAVYGTVMVGVLLAAEDTHHEGYPETIAADRTLLRRRSTHELGLVEGALMGLAIIALKLVLH